MRIRKLLNNILKGLQIAEFKLLNNILKGLRLTQNALKGQQMSAQGNALGIKHGKYRPERAKE